MFGARSPNEARTRAFFRRGVQCKLADDKYLSVYVAYRLVHFAVCISENAQTRYFSSEPINIFWAILFFNADENHQALIDCPANLFGDGNGGIGYSLNDCTHVVANYNMLLDDFSSSTAAQKFVDNWW